MISTNVYIIHRIIGVSKKPFEDTNFKGVIRIRKSKDRQHNDQRKKEQKDKQRSTKHYT